MSSIGEFSNHKEGSGIAQSVSDTHSEVGTDVLNIMKNLSKRTCLTHPEESVLYYCEDHRVECCVVCVANNHGQCSSAAVEDLIAELNLFLKSGKQPLCGNIDIGEYRLRSYFRRLENHFHLGEKKIKAFYDEIRRKVDEAEKNAMKTLDEIKNTELSLVTDHFKDYDELKIKMNTVLEGGECLLNIIAIHSDSVLSADSTELVTPTSGGLAADSYEKKHEAPWEDVKNYILAHENYMEEITEKLNELSELVKETNVDVVSKNAQEVLSVESSLYEIVTIIPPTPRSITEFKPVEEIKREGNVQSVIALPRIKGELFIVTTSPNKLQHVDSKGVVIKYVDLPSEPYGSCMYGAKIAVSFHGAKQITCYRSPDVGCCHSIKLTAECRGLCRIDDSFAVAYCSENVVRKVDDSGNIITSSEKIFHFPTIVHFFEHSNCILVSQVSENKVVALSADLKTVLFKMSHVDLRTPYGLCTDKFSGIYVCSQDKNCVLKFTKEGKYVSTILSAQELSFSSPYAICYNKQENRMYVAPRSSSKISIYKGIDGGRSRFSSLNTIGC